VHISVASLCCLVLISCSHVKNEPEEPPSELRRLIADAAIAGDGKRMLETLNRANLTQYSAKDKIQAQCIRARFAEDAKDEPDATLPPFVQEAWRTYRSYWRAVAWQRMPLSEAEAALRKSLVALLGTRNLSIPGDESLEDVSLRVKAEIETLGMYALTSVTNPYYELMLWRYEEDRIFDVPLVEGNQRARVSFTSEYVERGWLGFLTCNALHTGGWATRERIVQVGSLNSTTTSDSTFQTNLDHEAQHFADFIHFPAREQPELEYRAKLSQIALAKTPSLALTQAEKFLGTNLVPRDTAPHSFAEFWLEKHLRARMSEAALKTDGSQLQDLAKELILHTSAALRKAGATTSKRFLPE
jgi:hypothetical protein